MPLLEQVLEQYPSDVQVIYKNFPLRNHNFARPAAIAALAAGEQGKFWEFHDELFNNYNRLSEEKIKEIATSLQLDLERFEAERKNSSLQARISQDIQEGASVGVRGTPTIFVNGRLLKNRSIQGFREIIDRLLKTQGSSEGSRPHPEEVKKGAPVEG